jgi:hypothetical protein
VYATLEECGNQAEFNKAWDPASCCFTCKRPAAITTQPQRVNGVCNKEAVKNCYKEAPVCTEPAERTLVLATTSCCKACKPPGRLCKKEDVVECKKNTPECAAGEKPAYLEGECCASCRKAKPACSCPSGQLCVSTSEDDATEVCKPESTIKFEFNPTGDTKTALADVCTNPTASDKCPSDRDGAKNKMKALLDTVLDRLCDNPTKENLCGSLEAARSSLSVTKVERDAVAPKEALTVQLKIGLHTVPTSGGRRRLLQTSSTVDLVEAAVQDPEAAEGMTGGSVTVTGYSGGSTDAASAHGAGFAALVLAVCFF